MRRTPAGFVNAVNAVSADSADGAEEADEGDERDEGDEACPSWTVFWSGVDDRAKVRGGYTMWVYPLQCVCV